jgi:restriction system protein
MSQDNNLTIDDIESGEIKENIDFSIETLKKIEWYSFEVFCKIYYENIGYRVLKTKAGADGGVDLFLYQDGSEVPFALVQCKSRRNKEIGISYVRELLGVMTAQNVNKGILVTNSGFTKEAFEFANAHQIEPVDVSTLWMMVDELEAVKKAKLLSFLESTDFTTPTCPNCEVKLVERIQKNGKNIGQKFWGCVNFPRCRYTLQMAKAEGEQANPVDVEAL